jgi:hypothetical protein
MEIAIVCRLWGEQEEVRGGNFGGSKDILN